MLECCATIFFSQRLDRAWYDMDSGYDETQNPFADVSDEYTKKKEESMAKKAVKRMSAQQRQINKVNIYAYNNYRVHVHLNASYFKIHCGF